MSIVDDMYELQLGSALLNSPGDLKKLQLVPSLSKLDREAHQRTAAARREVLHGLQVDRQPAHTECEGEREIRSSCSTGQADQRGAQDGGKEEGRAESEGSGGG